MIEVPVDLLRLDHTDTGPLLDAELREWCAATLGYLPDVRIQWWDDPPVLRGKGWAAVRSEEDAVLLRLRMA